MGKWLVLGLGLRWSVLVCDLFDGSWGAVLIPSLIPNNAAFYATLRARREELGYHHLELDDYAGIADGHMSKIEMFDATYGKRPFNITETAETVLQALDLALVVMPREEAARLTSGTVDRKIHQRAGRNEGRAVVLSWAVRYSENATDK